MDSVVTALLGHIIPRILLQRGLEMTAVLWLTCQRWAPWYSEWKEQKVSWASAPSTAKLESISTEWISNLFNRYYPINNIFNSIEILFQLNWKRIELLMYYSVACALKISPQNRLFDDRLFFHDMRNKSVRAREKDETWCESFLLLSGFYTSMEVVLRKFCIALSYTFYNLFAYFPGDPSSGISL